MRFRFRIGPTVGEWRGSVHEARVDAVVAGFGSVDEARGVVFVDEMVEIESDERRD